MKKFITAMSLILGLGLANAQQTMPAKSAPAKTTAQTKTTKTTTAKPAMKMKADGTPDKRYKENKMLKKDGTPDKRYKANK